MSILLQSSHMLIYYQSVVTLTLFDSSMYFSVISLSDLFQNTMEQRILDFIKPLDFKSVFKKPCF